MEINPKIFMQKCIFLLIAVCLLMTVPALGQYEIRWSTIDGGGGQSSGGQYTLTGTIGQPDAGYSEGGDYYVLGGFWPPELSCFVDFHLFASFAQYWLETGPDLPADLYEDNIVDLYDLGEFVSQWLYYCPYNWPLRE